MYEFANAEKYDTVAVNRSNMIEELRKDPQQYAAHLAFVGQYQEMLAQEMRSASSGFSRHGQFGGGFGGNTPAMSSDADNTDAMRPRTPHGF